MANSLIGRMPPTKARMIRSTQHRLYHTARRITTIGPERYEPLPHKAEQPSNAATSAALPPLSALSALPTSMLVRSVCINAVSSKPFLLRPCLSILSALCRLSKDSVFNVDRNPLFHAILKGTFYKQFCTGETGAEVTATMRRLREMGFRGTILTYARETVFDHRTNTEHGMGVCSQDAQTTERCDNIAAWREGTLQTVDLLEEGDQLALKMTGAGPLVTSRLTAGELPPQQMLDALDEIAQRCQARGARLLIDAESQRFQAGIERVGLDLMRKHNRNSSTATVYNTYQAYLKSTPQRLAAHLAAAADEGFALGLKLVRGAYLASDARGLMHDTKAATDAAYDGIAQGAIRQQIGAFGGSGSGSGSGSRAFPAVSLIVAGHNKRSVLAAHALHRQRRAAGLPTVPVAFAQLHGMSDEVSFALLQLAGATRSGGEQNTAPDVYKCSTWGSLGDCLAYLTRRAAENRDAAGRTADEYAALKAEAGRRLRAVVSPSRWLGSR